MPRIWLRFKPRLYSDKPFSSHNASKGSVPYGILTNMLRKILIQN